MTTKNNIVDLCDFRELPDGAALGQSLEVVEFVPSDIGRVKVRMQEDWLQGYDRL